MNYVVTLVLEPQYRSLTLFTVETEAEDALQAIADAAEKSKVWFGVSVVRQAFASASTSVE